MEVQHHNSPINIEGVVYEIVRDYMLSKMKVVSGERNIAVKYRIIIGSNSSITSDLVDRNDRVRVKVNQSSSQYGVVKCDKSYLCFS